MAEHRLLLFHLHTNERINIVYRQGESYVPARSIASIIFCAITAPVTSSISIRVFSICSVISPSPSVTRRGDRYRVRLSHSVEQRISPRTTVGVAKHSQHMLGEAIDIRMPGVSTARLRDAALTLHRGGVGYYPQSQFVHVDLGPVRRW